MHKSLLIIITLFVLYSCNTNSRKEVIQTKCENAITEYYDWMKEQAFKLTPTSFANYKKKNLSLIDLKKINQKFADIQSKEIITQIKLAEKKIENGESCEELGYVDCNAFIKSSNDYLALIVHETAIQNIVIENNYTLENYVINATLKHETDGNELYIQVYTFYINSNFDIIYSELVFI